MMKVNEFHQGKCLANFILNQYTTEYGALIFNDSKEGSVKNSFYLRIESNNSSTNSFFDIYINKNSFYLQTIDFVKIKNFETVLNEDLALPKNDVFFNPKIDVSSWVNLYGSLRAMDYDETRYSNVTLKINAIIEHNHHDIVRIKFGILKNEYKLNDNVSFHTDEFKNITAFTFKSQKYVKVLLTKLNC